MLFSCFRPRMSEQTLASVCPTTMPSKFKVENARWEGDTLFNSLSLLIHTSYFLVQITPSISSVPGGFPCKMFAIFWGILPRPPLSLQIIYYLYVQLVHHLSPSPSFADVIYGSPCTNTPFVPLKETRGVKRPFHVQNRGGRERACTFQSGRESFSPFPQNTNHLLSRGFIFTSEQNLKRSYGKWRWHWVPEVAPIKCAVRESAIWTTLSHTGYTEIWIISHFNDRFLRKHHSHGRFSNVTFYRSASVEISMRW